VTRPCPESFAALARSSPARWSTVRFTERRRLRGLVRDVRAWVRRPDLLRVETLDGTLLQVVRQPPQRRPDGQAVDAPMFQDYFWVAMLDPVELSAGVVVDAVTEVQHAGRPAWEAVVRTMPDYEPRCGCCSLLRSLEVDVREYGPRSPHVLDEYPGAHRVRLDVGTGICVLTEQLGGPSPGQGHELRIEADNSPMEDSLFDGPPRVSSRGRPGRRRPAAPGVR
jgi:hypothetical protein